MNHELSSEAESLYKQHKQDSETLEWRQNQSQAAEQKLDEATRNLHDPNYRFSRRDDILSHPYGGGTDVPEQYAPAVIKSKAQNAADVAKINESQAQGAYDSTLETSAAHYTAHQGEYHEQAIQEAEAQGVHINIEQPKQ